MAKIEKGTSKNAKKNRGKGSKLYYENQEVKPIMIVRNPLGTSSIVEGILTKVASGKFKGVQIVGGSILMKSDIIVGWDEIAHLVKRK